MLDKVEKARAQMVQGQPFFGALALRLELLADPKTEVMSVDGKTLRYSPGWVESNRLPVVAAVVAHEVMHCALGHHTRMRGRDAERWHVACDHAINHYLDAAGFELPADRLQDARFTGMNADAIYAQLADEEPKAEEGGEEAGGSEPGKGAKGDGQPGAADGAGDPAAAQGDAQGAGQPSVGGCGSFAEPAADDGAAASPGELAAQAQEWEIATVQAANAANAAGNLPGAFREMVEQLKRGAVDWREELRRFFLKVTPTDFRMVPPNRRYVSQGLYLPTLRNEAIGELVVAIDTSCSITAALLAQFEAELNAVLEEARPERVTVVYADTKVHRSETFEPEDGRVAITAVGRGGTRFSPTFRWVEEQGIEPAALIYLTDLDCADFGPEPAYPVLWATTRKEAAPWGDIVPVKP